MQRKLNISKIEVWYPMLPENLQIIVDDAISTGALKIPVAKHIKRWWSKLLKG